MAAIAKFVSYDGGIAFSASSLKIQKRDEDLGRIMPVAEIAALEVSEPLFGDDGSITVLLNGERLASRENTLYFDDEQYGEAVQFKVAFDTMMEGRHTALPPLDMFQPAAMVSSSAGRSAQRPPRPHSGVCPEYDASARTTRRRPAKRSKIKRIIIGVVALYAVLLGVGGIALLFDGNTTKSSGGGLFQQQIPSLT